MRDKLIEIIENGERKVLGHTIRGTRYYTEALADYLIANDVFLVPEQMKDSWELALPFMMRLFATDEEQIEKVHREFESKEVKQILTDIRDYLAEKKKICDATFDLEREMFIDTLLSDLTEYAEKLGVEL